jgi:hypothetical protein
MNRLSTTRRIRHATGLFLLLLVAGFSPVSAEDAPIEGGLSPNKKLEVRRVRVMAGPLKGSYNLHLFETRSSTDLKQLHTGGYFSYEEAVLGACTAFWHPSGRYVAVLNVEKKDVSSVYLFAVDKDTAKEIPMPDYALRVLLKFREGKRGFYEGPQARWPEWVGDELQFRVLFKVPPPKKTENVAPPEYESFVAVTPVERDGELRAEVTKLSPPTSTFLGR